MTDITAQRLTYAVVTPARNEADNLRRLADSLTSQTAPPNVWLIIDNGSTDETAAVAGELRRRHEWIHAISTPGESAPTRGAPVVRAFNAGLAALERPCDIVVKLDADVSLDEPDYFERLLAAFARDGDLGMASGTEYALDGGVWRQRFGTRASVWGPARAYRWKCLEDVSPLEERMGWDTIDELKANLRGWRTLTLPDLPYRHHRREGERDGASRLRWEAQGDLAHYLGYRVSYLLLRTLHRMRRDPAAAAMLWGFVKATARGEQRHPDPNVRDYLRRRQRLRELPARMREALGLRTGQTNGDVGLGTGR